MTTKEVAQICGVTEECIRQNAKVIGVELGDRWHPHEWTEDEMKKIQIQLMANAQNNNVNASDVVKASSKTVLGEGLAANIIANSGDVEAMKEYCEMLMQKTQAQHELLLAQKKNQQLQLEYQKEKEEHQKDKELVLHKYLTATQIKETIFKEYGKSIVVSKAVQRIPLDDNDILYKPFKNGNYTGQQPVYHPNVLDKIREILG